MGTVNGERTDFGEILSSTGRDSGLLLILLVADKVVGLTSLTRVGWRARSGQALRYVDVFGPTGGDWMKAHRWFNTVELFMLWNKLAQ